MQEVGGSVTKKEFLEKREKIKKAFIEWDDGSHTLDAIEEAVEKGSVYDPVLFHMWQGFCAGFNAAEERP